LRYRDLIGKLKSISIQHWAKIVVFLIGFGLTIFAARVLLADIRDDAEARNEYEHLRN
jgi:hypothetical protein